MATRLATSTALQGRSALLHAPLLHLQTGVLLQRRLLTQSRAAWVRELALRHADIRAMLDQLRIELLVHRLPVRGGDL